LFGISSDNIQSITLYNALGSKVKTIEAKANLVDISDLPQGYYFVSFLQKDGQVIVKQFIKE